MTKLIGSLKLKPLMHFCTVVFINSTCQDFTLQEKEFFQRLKRMKPVALLRLNEYYFESCGYDKFDLIMRWSSSN